MLCYHNGQYENDIWYHEYNCLRSKHILQIKLLFTHILDYQCNGGINHEHCEWTAICVQTSVWKLVCCECLNAVKDENSITKMSFSEKIEFLINEAYQATYWHIQRTHKWNSISSILCAQIQCATYGYKTLWNNAFIWWISFLEVKAIQ